MSILLSFFDISRLISNWSCNILFIDELLDQNIDQSGIEQFVSTLHNLICENKKKLGIYIISHKLNELKDNIERTCEMEMVAPMCPDEYEFMAYLPTGKYGRVDYEAIIKMFKEENDEQEDLKDDLSDVDPRDGI